MNKLTADRLEKFLFGHGKLVAFISGAAIAFVISSVFFLLAISPFFLAGSISSKTVLFFAFCIGVGSAAANGAFCAIES